MPKRSTLRLTKRIVDGLTIDSKNAVFWDRNLAGFGVRVHATGHKTYVVQLRGPAGLKRVTLGSCEGETIKQRRREAAEVIDRIKWSEDPMPPERAPEPTVAELAARCLSVEFGVRCKPTTAKSYKMALDRHILPAFGAMPLKEVGPAEAAALHHRMRDMPSMANRAVWVLSRLFVLAETWEIVPRGRNPCRHIEYYPEKSRERFLTPEEFRRLRAALRKFEAMGSVWASAVAALRLLMLTGCRTSEILFLRWDDVDRTAGVLRLPDRKTGVREMPQICPNPLNFVANTNLCRGITGIGLVPVTESRFGSRIPAIWPGYATLQDIRYDAVGDPLRRFAGGCIDVAYRRQAFDRRRAFPAPGHAEQQAVA